MLIRLAFARKKLAIVWVKTLSFTCKSLFCFVFYIDRDLSYVKCMNVKAHCHDKNHPITFMYIYSLLTHYQTVECTTTRTFCFVFVFVFVFLFLFCFVLFCFVLFCFFNILFEGIALYRDILYLRLEWFYRTF